MFNVRKCFLTCCSFKLRMAEKSVPRALALPAVGTLLTGYIRFISAQDLQDCRQRLGLLGDHYKHGQPWPSQTVPADASEEQKGEFMRAYRQYMNLVEWTGIAQCIFWTSAIMTREAYGVKSKAFKWVAYASVFWPVARLGYGMIYARNLLPAWQRKPLPDFVNVLLPRKSLSTRCTISCSFFLCVHYGGFDVLDCGFCSSAEYIERGIFGVKPCDASRIRINTLKSSGQNFSSSCCILGENIDHVHIVYTSTEPENRIIGH